MGRLFWKLFMAFWLAFALIIVGGWAAMKLYHNYLERELFEESARPEVLVIARALENRGPDVALKILRTLRVYNQSLNVYVIDDDGYTLDNRPSPSWLRQLVHRAKTIPLSTPHRYVKTPSGKRYLVISRAPYNPRPGFLLRYQWLILPLAGIVSLLICFLLARYLSRPINKMRKATSQFATGDLEMRMAPLIGHRKDEIADLAHDFDNMADQLNLMIVSQKQLLRDVSHELRSPLARIQMALGLLQKRHPNLTDRELNRIEKDCNRLEELVEQVLTLSRLESSIEDSRIDLVDLKPLLKKIVEDCNFEAAASNRSINLMAESSPSLMANAELLRQALENITRNAIRYTPEHKPVTIELTLPEPGKCQISICDQGPGVAEDMLENLFDPFVQVSDAREQSIHQTKRNGFGLGLAIAKRAIEQHSGEIRAENNPSGGLCVIVCLPLGVNTTGQP